MTPKSLESLRGAAGARAAAGVRIARYSAYPRSERSHGIRSGYARNAPGAGLTLVTAAPEGVGELLRIRIQDLGERETRDTIARVVSCEPLRRSRFQLSLARVASPAPAQGGASPHFEFRGERLEIGRESM